MIEGSGSVPTTVKISVADPEFGWIRIYFGWLDLFEGQK
jgi:hypothetical protein